MANRNPNFTSSIYKGADGYWHGRVTVGVRDDGRQDRRHVMYKKKADTVKKVRELEKQREAGRVRKTGRAWTVQAWLVHWLDNIAQPTLRQTSFSAYRVAVHRHLIPGVGGHRLDRLEPEHLERLYRRMTENGSKAATAHQVHRTIRTALGEAVRRGHIPRNPAEVAKAPRISQDLVDPFSVEDVQRILKEAGNRRNSARWAVALALGLRQGEALALRWRDVDLDRGTVHVRSTRLRPAYAHGCGETCGRAAGYCPQRRCTTPEAGEAKSSAGKRVIGLPDQLVDLLVTHRGEQAQERKAARHLWQDGDWVFATPTGGPLNPNTDYHQWKSLLKDAGVRDGRLHDARHTAATVLLLLGVPERAVMGIMGWSSTSMAARYQHITDPIRRDVARRVGGLLWSDPEPSGNDDPDDDGDQPSQK